MVLLLNNASEIFGKCLSRPILPGRWIGYVVHHSYNPDGHDGRPEIEIVRSIDTAHRLGWKYKEKGILKIRPGWLHGLGYHFVVGIAGALYIGDRWIGQFKGAHCPGKNGDHLGICFLGNFDVDKIGPEQAETFKGILKTMGDRSLIPPAPARCVLHREIRNTECPGKNITRETIKSILEG